MSIENELFKRRKVDFEKLINYGFQKNGLVYRYTRIFMDDFRADIEVDQKGKLSGKVYDLSAGDEYVNFRIESQIGAFVSQVREAYIHILRDISEQCFKKLYFIGDQSNRITDRIHSLYQHEPEFLWEKFSSYGVFKNSSNHKWYGIIMNLDWSKLDSTLSGEVEVLNVKLDSNKIEQLLARPGFFPAYHMNKKNWITIVLDQTISDEEIMMYVKESYQYTEVSSEWIIPANPNFYDVIHCFEQTDIISWKQSSNIQVGDIVYLYVGAPYSAILYRCLVIEVHLPYKYKDQNIRMDQVMRIQLLESYDSTQYPFSKLKEYGIHAIRGPRRMPSKLSEEINHKKLIF